ncbi:MAG: sigma 54-interacting transcriptional regulator [candidate division Zixibacteria bacterium]|nr:sigma 54-interacting transcriptional regulator [candidate division Zixibacteria bacterium]
MPKNLESYIKTLNVKLSLVESLLQEGNFKQALAEIRELENQKMIDDFSAEAGELSYLAAFALDKLGRPKQALTKAKKAYEILRNTEKNTRVAQVQHIMGMIYAQLGELKNAEVQFTDTASTYRRIKDQKGIAEIYNELARICFIRSQFNRAVEYVNDALDLCRQTNDQKMIARLHGNLGTILMLKDQWKKAEKNLLIGLQANEALHDKLNICRSLLSLGNLSCLLRKFQSAEEYLRRALNLISENNFLRELAIYQEYQGSLELARGDLGLAQKYFQEAIHIGEQIGPKGAIISQAYRLLAELQTERGEFENAQASCEKSLLASKSIGEKLEEAMAYRALGRLFSRNGHPAEVKKNFAQATRMLEEIGVKFELAKTYLDMGKSDSFPFWERMKFLGRAEDLASQLDSLYYLALVHATFAQLFLQNDKLAEAQDFLDKAKCVFERSDEKADLGSLSALEKKIKAHQPANQSIYVNSSYGFAFADIITRDRATLKILESVRRIKDLDITILLEGETGTGKDLLAKVIHYTSNRKDKRFVVASCAALPETLFESELFGHKKGAFTGAVADKKGLLDEAVGGTLYLDEIAEVPLSIQVKLLRAIEEKEIVRIGEVKPRKIDFRVIAATNIDLDKLVQEGGFRSDLFYRLNGMRFRLPPLRERREDISLLVKYFLKKHSVGGLRQNSVYHDSHSSPTVPTLDPKIMELFSNYDWPGNVRELENEVKRVLISSRGEDKITFALLAGSLEKFGNGKSSQPTSLLTRLAKYEKEQIEKALAKSNGVKAKAARLLNIDEALLRYKIKKYNLSFP